LQHELVREGVDRVELGQAFAETTEVLFVGVREGTNEEGGEICSMKSVKWSIRTGWLYRVRTMPVVRG